MVPRLHRLDSMRYHALVIIAIWLTPSVLRAQASAQSPMSSPPAQLGIDAPAPQPAATPVNRFLARPLVVEGHIGAGTPLGLLGAAVDYSPSPWFAAGIGAGAGAAGAQAALMARFRIPVGEGVGVGLGGGVSGGNYEWTEGGLFSMFIDKPASKIWKPAYWANADVSIEGRLEGGFSIRGYLGRGALLNGDDGQCKAGSSSELNHCMTAHQKDGRAIGYAGLAMGYAFSL
jgi:hypothetical protein